VADAPGTRDLRLTGRGFDVTVSDRSRVDLTVDGGGDLATVTGRANLAQAIVNRLCTRRGELARLGHPEYGSRLHTLIGERNVTRARGLAEIYIRESLGAEPRIAQIVQIALAPPSRDDQRSTLQVQIVVQPVTNGDASAPGGAAPLSIVLPIGLGG